MGAINGILMGVYAVVDVKSVAYHSYNIQATSKGSDQSALMRKLV